MATLLTTAQLSKTYQRRGSSAVSVLGSVDLQIEPGDKVAILGKSGAGKSTLLHILGTLEAPTSGKVMFEGEDIFRYREKKLSEFRNRELGFVFQFHHLMLEFSALENVMMPALLGRQSRNQAKQKALALLARVGLEDRLTHKPNQLSGGEQQRVAIARALIMKPKLLLTDEMTGNLDPSTARQVFSLVEELHQEMNVAMVSVTHDEQLAASYKKIYRLEAGHLITA